MCRRTSSESKVVSWCTTKASTGLTRDRGVDGLGHELGVVAGALDRGAQAGQRGVGHARPSLHLGSRAGHGSVPGAPRSAPRSARAARSGAGRARSARRAPPARRHAASRDHRVELERGDLGQVVGQPGQPGQQVLERGDVDRGAAAVAEQQRRGPDAAHQAVQVAVGQRRDAVATGRRAGRSPRRRARRTRPGRTAGPRRVRQPRSPRRWAPSPARRSCSAVLARAGRPSPSNARPQLGRVVDVEPHAAELAAVPQVRRGGLERDRVAELAGRRPRASATVAAGRTSHRSMP